MGVVILLYIIVEIAAIAAVASAIGAMWTVALLAGGAVLGSALARREGARAMQAVLAAGRAGRPAHSEITDSMLIGLGGVLILLPGFVSDLFGLLAILPPTRSLLRKRWIRAMDRRTHGMFSAGTHRQATVVDGDVVDGEVVDGDVVDGDVVDDRDTSGTGNSEPRRGQHNPRIIDPGQ